MPSPFPLRAPPSLAPVPYAHAARARRPPAHRICTTLPFWPPIAPRPPPSDPHEGVHLLWGAYSCGRCSCPHKARVPLPPARPSPLNPVTPSLPSPLSPFSDSDEGGASSLRSYSPLVAFPHVHPGRGAHKGGAAAHGSARRGQRQAGELPQLGLGDGGDTVHWRRLEPRRTPLTRLPTPLPSPTPSTYTGESPVNTLSGRLM